MKKKSGNKILDAAQYFGVHEARFNDSLGTNAPPLFFREEMVKKWSEALNLRDQYLERISCSYDVNFLNEIRLVVVGTGGAASLLRNAARMGVGEFVLIDPDNIEAPNVGTQDAWPNDIGSSKINAIAKDLVLLNPAAAVLSLQNKIEDIDDNLFKQLIARKLRWDDLHRGSPGNWAFVPEISPQKTILLILTDNFQAQARGHRLGLHFGLPTICAQEYREGLGAEVTYTIPGVTPACHRCITASRYSAYLDNGYKNNVTSAGAPVFAAEFLNAVLGHILLAVIHHGTDHSRWGKVIDELGDRNLIRLRMDNSFDTIFGDAFGRRTKGAKEENALYTLDSLFLSQDPDCGQTTDRPICPDCGGTGDLQHAIGSFDDTRKMHGIFDRASSF